MARPSAEELAAGLAEAMAPLPPIAAPVVEAPKPIAVPVSWPETQQEVAERMKDAIREEGAGDPEPWRQRTRVLRITEEDGQGGDGRVSEIRLDPSYNAYLMVETTGPDPAEPWRMVETSARMGLHSIRRLELVDVEG